MSDLIIFAGVTMTSETLKATDEWFADNADQCVKAALAGRWKVNNLDQYVEHLKETARKSRAGLLRNSFTYAQRAHFIQTGQSVPLFSK